MVLKRKRNLKADASTNYAIYVLDLLEAEYLEDYIEVRDSGMEAEEEKETQLQKIIQDRDGSIPLPVIKQIENPVRSEIDKIPVTNKRIKWHRDCPNEYIEDVTVVENFLQELDKKDTPTDSTFPLSTPTQSPPLTIPRDKIITRNGRLWIPLSTIPLIHEAIRKYPENQTAAQSPTTNKALVEFVAKRSIVRYDEKGEFKAYSAFRRRIYHPTFKARRNEGAIIDKLERLSDEFSSQRLLCELLHEKCELELERLKKDKEVLRAIMTAQMDRKERRVYKKKLLGIPDEDLFSKGALNIHALMTNRTKIYCLKETPVGTELFLDLKYFRDVHVDVPEDTEEEARKKMCRRCV